MMDVSDEENCDIINPSEVQNGDTNACECNEDDEGNGLDDIVEEGAMPANTQHQLDSRFKLLTEPRVENNDGNILDQCSQNGDGDICTHMGKRRKVNEDAPIVPPSAIDEEREARENAETEEFYASDVMTDDDPDLVRDEDSFSKCRPIMRDTGKSKPCYRVPFSACVHMPFVNETGMPIEPYIMTAERYNELVGKHAETTKEIINEVTHARLSQMVCIFRVFGVKKSTGANSLRSYAAFIRVKVTDFDDDKHGLQQTLSDGQALYQLEPKTFARAFTGEHGLKLPKSCVPSPKAVEYVKLMPKIEAETKPEGWIACPIVGDGKSNKRGKDKTDKDKSSGKHKTGESTRAEGVALAASEETTAVTVCDAAPTAAAPISASMTMPASVYTSYAFVKDSSSTSTVVAPIPSQSTLSNSATLNTAEWRSETYNFNLQGRKEWPMVGPSFDFDPRYSTMEVSFKIYRKS
jgi:hypothetical protein